MNADDTLDHSRPPDVTSDFRLCPMCGRRVIAMFCPDDDTATVNLPDPETGDRFIGRILDGRFRVRRCIGQGGMGRVYLATQLNLDLQVAIKVILTDRQASESAVQRFHREAKATTRLTSPHVVRVFDFGVDPVTSSPFLVMEYLEGRTLAGLLAVEGPLAPRRAAAIVAQILRALVEAETRSIVHRDIKPENIFLVQNGEQADFVKVMDFGVARSVSGTPDGLGSLTQNGHIVGTPAYMSPEQIAGHRVDTRSDLYAVGCLLHEMLTGAPPYAGSDPGVPRMLAHVTEPPPTLPAAPPTLEPIPDALRHLHACLLEKAVPDRPASAAQALEMLLSAMGDGPASAAAAVTVQTEARLSLQAGALLNLATEPTSTVQAPGRPEATRPARAVGATALMAVAGIVIWAATRGSSASAVSSPSTSLGGTAAIGAPAIGTLVTDTSSTGVTANPSEPVAAVEGAAAAAALATIPAAPALGPTETRAREPETGDGERREPATSFDAPQGAPWAGTVEPEPRTRYEPVSYREDKPGRGHHHRGKGHKKHRKKRD